MAALTAARATDQKPAGKRVDAFPVASATTIYKGSMVALNSSGYLVPAAATGVTEGGMIAEETVVNASGGSLWCDASWNTVGDYTASATLTQAHVGDPMYFVDDQTFASSGTVFAGFLIEYTSATRGKIYLPGPVTNPTTGTTASASELNALDASLTTGQRLCFASGTLTSAQLLDLKDTQITCVAAPGAGRAIVPITITLVHDHGGTDYIQAAGSDHLALRYTDGSGAEIDEIGTEAQCTTFLEASADALLVWSFGDIGYVPVANAAVVFDNNGATDLTTGNGEVDWYLTYLTVPAAA